MPVPNLPPHPGRNEQESEFAQKAADWVASLQPWTDAVNLVEQTITTAAQDVSTNQGLVSQDRTLAQQAAAAAAASALSAVQAPGTNGTSITPMTVGTGERTFATQANKLWVIGQTVVIASAASPANRMIGFISAYNSATGAMTVQVDSAFGSGSFNSWVIGLSAPASIPVASVEDLWAGTDVGKAVTAAVIAQSEEFRALTDAATINWNVLTHGWNVSVVLNGNRTLGLPTGLRLGRVYTLQIIQPPTSPGRTLALPTNFRFGQAGTPVLSTGANAIDEIRFQVTSLTGWSGGPRLSANFKKDA